MYEAIPVGGTGYGLNNNGIVVGSINTDSYYWTTATGRVIVGPTTYTNRVTDINDANILVGSTMYAYDYGRQKNYSSFAYDVGRGEMVTPEIRMTQDVMAINNLGNTVGQNKIGDYPNGSQFQGASHHVTGVDQTSLFTWGDGNFAFDINDRSVAVGMAGKVRTPAGWITLPGSGTTSAYGINDYWNGGDPAGRICGSANGLPAYWDGAGNLHVVNPPEITAGVFRKVNDHGQMVGQVTYDGVKQGAVYQNGQLILLNDGVTSVSTLDAIDINDRGQILVSVSIHAYLLNPVYFADGSFTETSLDLFWQQSGSGSASMLDDGAGDYCLVLTAGSPIAVTQPVSTPDAAFRLSFDYRFLTVDALATLNVELNGILIASLTAPAALEDGFLTHEIPVSEMDLRGLSDVTLSLSYEGPSGSQVWIDDIVISQDDGMAAAEPPPMVDFRVTSISAMSEEGQLWLTWTSVPSGTYSIEGSTDLTPTSWTELVSGILSQGYSTIHSVSIASTPYRFFRVGRQP